MQTWAVNYKGDIITVEKRQNKSTLYLNGRVIDSQGGPLGGSLIGKTSSGEAITAAVNTSFFVKCYCNIYVDGVKIFVG